VVGDALDRSHLGEPLAKLPSHRILALFRGEKEKVLTLELVPEPAESDRGEPSTFERQISNRFKIADRGRPGDRWLIDTVRLAWRTRILTHVENDLRLRLWQAAEDAAVQVFAANLRGSSARGPRGRAYHDGARSGISDRRQSRCGHRDRSSRGDADDLGPHVNTTRVVCESTGM